MEIDLELKSNDKISENNEQLQLKVNQFSGLISYINRI